MILKAGFSPVSFYQTLHLRALKRDGPSRFLAFGARSAWSLRMISLKEMRATDCAVCLRSLPSVTEVEMDVPCDQPTQLIMLLRENPFFLPAVHALMIRDCGPEISPSLLTDMLESRSTRDGKAGVLPNFSLAQRFGGLRRRDLCAAMSIDECFIDSPPDRFADEQYI
jgi:hypothetical protein